MSEEPALSSDEKELMESLAGLRAAPVGVSEQAVWFEAGRRAGRKQSRVWMGATAAAVLVSTALAVVRPKPGTIYVERTVVQKVEMHGGLAVAGTPHALSTGASDYIRLRDAVEQGGMDAISEPSGDGSMDQPSMRALSPRNMSSAPSPWESLNTRG